MTAGFVLAVIFLIVVGFTIFSGIRIVPQGSKYVIQCLGKYHSTLARIFPVPVSSRKKQIAKQLIKASPGANK